MKRAAITEKIGFLSLALSALLVVSVLFWILGDIFFHGAKVINWDIYFPTPP